MSCRSARKIPRSLSKSLAQSPLPSNTTRRPLKPITPVATSSSNIPSIPLAPITLSSPPPASPDLLARFVHSHLLTSKITNGISTSSPSFTPVHLLHFLQKKLRHHPSFAAYDLHVFCWASDVDSFRHDHSTFEWMTRTLALTHRLHDLRYVLEFMSSHPCPCSDGIFACQRLEPIYRFALNAFCNAGRFQDAVLTFEEMKRSLDGKPDVALYNIVMSGFARHRMHKDVMGWYDRMLREKVKPDSYTFNIMIGSCCRSSRFDSALGLFREMKAVGCWPNVVSFNTLIRGFFRENKVEEGIGVAREMLHMSCGLSAVTCDIVFDELCRKGRTMEACGFLMEMVDQDAVPDGFDCLGLVESLCADRKVDRAFEITHFLWEKGKMCGAVTYNALLEALRRSGKVGKAYGLAERMVEEGMVPDLVTLNGLLELLCDSGRAVDANRLRVVASRKGFRPDYSTFRVLIGGFSTEGRLREGELVLDEMLDEGFVQNITDYNRFLERLHKGNEQSPETVASASGYTSAVKNS